MVLYAATTNAGKIRDFAAAGSGMMAVLPLPGIREIPAPAEDAPDFAGNARLKAEYYSRQTPGLIVMADDSGLEVDALDGAPGVRSARFAEDRGFRTKEVLSVDDRNNRCLLEALQGVPTEGRKGRYRCVLAVAKDGTVLHVADGAVEGDVLEKARGEGGFGYDPFFYLPEVGRTMAELSAEEKWEHSHRGRAFRQLIKLLNR